MHAPGCFFFLGWGGLWEKKQNKETPFRNGEKNQNSTQTVTQAQDWSRDPEAVRCQCYRLHHPVACFISNNIANITHIMTDIHINVQHDLKLQTVKVFTTLFQLLSKCFACVGYCIACLLSEFTEIITEKISHICIISTVIMSSTSSIIPISFTVFFLSFLFLKECIFWHKMC